MKAAGWATALWLLLVVLAPAVAMEQLGLWWQCGGLSACRGSGCGDSPWPHMQCGTGLACDRQNEWYWQCIPQPGFEQQQQARDQSPPPPPGQQPSDSELGDIQTVAGEWGQCGGINGCPAGGDCGDIQWATCIPPGWACIRQDEWYRQCRPARYLPPPPPPSPSPSPSPRPSPPPPRPELKPSPAPPPPQPLPSPSPSPMPVVAKVRPSPRPGVDEKTVKPEPAPSPSPKPAVVPQKPARPGASPRPAPATVDVPAEVVTIPGNKTQVPTAKTTIMRPTTPKNVSAPAVTRPVVPRNGSLPAAKPPAAAENVTVPAITLPSVTVKPNSSVPIPEGLEEKVPNKTVPARHHVFVPGSPSPSPAVARSPRPLPEPSPSAPLPESPAPPKENVQLGLLFSGISPEEFQEKYSNGTLAAISQITGIPAELIKPTYTPASAISGRKLLQAGVIVDYNIPTADRAATLGKISDATANNGLGFYSALAANGVPLRPAISVNGELAVQGPEPQQTGWPVWKKIVVGVTVGVGGFLLLLALCLLAFWCWRKRKQKRSSAAAGARVGDEQPAPDAARPLEGSSSRDQQTARKRAAASIKSPFANHPKPAMATSATSTTEITPSNVRSFQDPGASSSRAAGIGTGAAIGAGAAAVAASVASGSSVTSAGTQASSKKTSWRPVLGPWRSRPSQSTSEVSEYHAAAGGTTPRPATSEITSPSPESGYESGQSEQFITPRSGSPASALSSSPDNGVARLTTLTHVAAWKDL